jgi:hypothetical protein
MTTIEPARSTHHHDGELVVFLIGMTINRPWRPDLWLPAFLAMPTMLRELAEDAESGLMGYRLTFGWRGPTVIQYWNSVDKLYAYASDGNAKHRPAWAAFNRRARKAPGAVGVWHETYPVSRAESVYVGTPAMGLAQATARVPVSQKLSRARNRLSHSNNTHEH